jgi:hypothetical protein
MRQILLLICIFSITVTAKAQLLDNWTEGSYYKPSGEKVTGFIAWVAPLRSFFKGNGDHIFFKTSKNASEIKLRDSEIKSFTMKTDSFVISHNENLRKAPFLQVLVNNQSKLYLSARNVSVSTGSRYGMAFYDEFTYYFGNDPEHIIALDSENFIEFMSVIMSDKPDVVAKIADKTYKYRSIKKLITYYNNYKTP